MSARLSLLWSIVATPRLVGLAFILAIGLTVVVGVSLVAAQQDEPVDPAAIAVFDACVNNHNGNLRLIPPDRDCRGQETRIQLGGAAADAALGDRIAALEATTTSQQTLIETQQGQIEALLADVGTLQQDNANLQGTIETLTQQNADQQVAVDLLQEENGDREQEIMALEGQLGDLQAQVPACLSTEGNEVYFTGCNVHVRSGSGSTSGAVNGLGNLIIGYDEGDVDSKTGSHNLVVGQGHTYTSYGGFVAGVGNTISGPYSSVSGGRANTASSSFSSVSGGNSNTASGQVSSVSGGHSNTASGDYGSVSGGFINTASGLFSSITGGEGSIASGESSSISSGLRNIASNDWSSVSGGYQNRATSLASSVSGGSLNTAGNFYASVSGGYTNAANGTFSSVSGGYGNAANGDYSSISGGADGSVVGDNDWRAGDDFFSED